MDASEPLRTSDANGAYSFSGIRSGVYRIVEVLAATYISAEGKSTTQLVSAFTGGTSTVDFFNLVPVKGTVQGVLWDDANGNGLQEATESRLEGWTVYIDSNFNGALDGADIQSTTNATGGYVLAGVAYGTNIIREVVQPTLLPPIPLQVHKPSSCLTVRIETQSTLEIEKRLERFKVPFGMMPMEIGCAGLPKDR